MPGYVVLLIILAVFVVAVVLGIVLGRVWRVRESTTGLVVVLLCLLGGIAIVVVGWPPKLGLDLRGGTVLVYETHEGLPLSKPASKPAKDQQPPQGSDVQQPSMEKLIASVTRRVNPGGIKEVMIRPQGASAVEIRIPEVGQAEIDRLKRILSLVGTIEFRVLANQRDDKTLIEQALKEDSREVRSEAGQLLAWWVPVTKSYEGNLREYTEIATRTKTEGDQPVTEVLVVDDDYNLGGDHLLRAAATMDRKGKRGLRFHLDPEGGQRLGGLTNAKLPDKVGSFTRKLGMILDGRLYAAPPISEAVFQDGEIPGNFTEQEAKDWADVLTAGAFPKTLGPAPIRELVAGPVLGKDTIGRGAVALALVLAVVFALLLITYRFAGLIACGALLLNLLLLAAGLLAIRTTLTLAGLAGLVLAIVQAVGAHVLIFERIREELGRQSPLRTAIRNGFGKARSGIVDVGAALLITATILYLLGNEQVKGFAVTLWLGAVLSLLTAVYCSRVVFDVAERRRWITTLSMMRLPIPANPNLLGKGMVAGIVSAVAVVLSLTVVCLRGPSMPNIDFTGGVSVEMAFREPQDLAAVRHGLSALADVAVADAHQPGEAPGYRYLVGSSTPAGREASDYLEEVKTTIQKAFGDKLAGDAKSPFPLAGTVGGSIAPSALDQMVYAVLVSLMCIIGYLWVRFQRPTYGLTAAITLAHDVAITLGLFALSHYVAAYLGFLLIEPFRIGVAEVVAMLTVFGFSLAGTVILFDRVRDTQGKARLLNDEKVATSLNQTLSRTLFTSLAMLLAALGLYIAGPGIRGFAFILVVGTIVATYSSTFLAAPILLWLNRPAVSTEPPPALTGTGKRRS